MRKKWRLIATCVSLFSLISISGCASTSNEKNVFSKALVATGLKEPTPQEPASVTLRVFGGTNLNAANDKRATAAVVKIYHLRSPQRFAAAPFNAFLDQAGEQAALGADLLSVNEVILTPGAKRDFEEKLSSGSTTIGIVTLFRAPAENRWRFAFDVSDPKKLTEGITVGIHACSMTTPSPTLLTKVSGSASSLASVRCSTGKI